MYPEACALRRKKIKKDKIAGASAFSKSFIFHDFVMSKARVLNSFTLKSVIEKSCFRGEFIRISAYST